MAYPRTDCQMCERNVAVTPKGRKTYRHDPPERDPELKSCPGSLRLVTMAGVDDLTLFDVPDERNTT